MYFRLSTGWEIGWLIYDSLLFFFLAVHADDDPLCSFPMLPSSSGFQRQNIKILWLAKLNSGEF